ncbi:MAG: response regulator [Pirellulaceae bacterium]
MTAQPGQEQASILRTNATVFATAQRTKVVGLGGAHGRSDAAAATLPLRGRILCADDGVENQRLIDFLLRKAGAEVTIVENGQLAVEQALAAEQAGCPFDLILMDMNMPVLDGFDATRTLRSAGYTRPILALTAHTQAADREKCLSAGCDDFHPKPVQFDSLCAAIRRHLAPLPSRDAERLPLCAGPQFLLGECGRGEVNAIHAEWKSGSRSGADGFGITLAARDEDLGQIRLSEPGIAQRLG